MRMRCSTCRVLKNHLGWKFTFMEVLSREELNKQAHLLAERISTINEGVYGPGSGLSLVEKKLEEECSQIRANICLIREECSRLPPVPTFNDEDSPQSLQLSLKKLESELKVWQKEQSNVVCKDPAVIDDDAHQKLSDNLEQLRTTLSMVKQELAAAEEKLGRERQLLEESQQIERTLTEKIAAMEEGDDSVADVSLEMKLRIAAQSSNTLEEALKSFIETHLPQSSDNVGRKRRRHKQATLDTMWATSSQLTEQQELPSLTRVIQDLISKCLDTPHDPYLPVRVLWPPHMQLLLRCNVIQRHPDNPTLIRLTPFHH